MPPLIWGVSEFVAVVNQTLEYAYNSVVISGELANFKISKGKWVYFDLKDENASVRFFGTVYVLPGPLEDGMVVVVRGTPKLHPNYGFSVNITSIQPAGVGSIKKAANLLEEKLISEGLFAPERKRLLPFPPARIGLITSSESAAYHDFTKVLDARFRGLEITLADVQVQGEAAPAQIVEALEKLNQLPLEVVVITRGGGSAEDLAAFSDERVVRAVAASRIPTLVAIGHEVDISLAELAADTRASTPSNAAELLVPDIMEITRELKLASSQLDELALDQLETSSRQLGLLELQLGQLTASRLDFQSATLDLNRQLLRALDPSLPLARGYALVRDDNGKIIRRASEIAKNAIVNIEISDAEINARVERINAKI